MVEEDWMKVAAQLQQNRARLEEIAVPMGEGFLQVVDVIVDRRQSKANVGSPGIARMFR